MPCEQPFWFGMPENSWKCIVKGELVPSRTTRELYKCYLLQWSMQENTEVINLTCFEHLKYSREYSSSRNGIAPCAAK